MSPAFVFSTYFALDYKRTDKGPPLQSLELRMEIEKIAGDLLVGHREDHEWWAKYPRW
jgi:hypothetical protein